MGDGYNKNFIFIYYDRVNFNFSNFYDANCQYAQFTGASLVQASFDKADLLATNFFNATISCADFQQADIRYAIFWGTNIMTALFPFKVMFLYHYNWPIFICADTIRIGCQCHTIKQWKDFNAEQIENMGDEALSFWRWHKYEILEIACAFYHSYEKDYQFKDGLYQQKHADVGMGVSIFQGQKQVS